MRIWQDAQGSLLTDEQFVRYVAAYGSLSRALEAGDVRIVVPDGNAASPSPEGTQPMERETRAKLSALI